ncbi:MAG: hypothetical protein WAV21_00075 [Minisyncoccia bacterium]
MISARVYAKALARLSLKDAANKNAVQNLVTHLRGAGRIKLLPAILSELKSIEARAAKLSPRVEVAREADVALSLAAARKEGIETTEARVNPNLVRGWRAMNKGMLVDRSAKHSLVELYRNITTR